MRILAVETSGPVGTVAALADGALLGEWQSTVSNAHGESVFALLDQALLHTGWNKLDVDLWAAGIGPGSFTGVRVAVTTIVGITMALERVRPAGVRATGVTSFQAMRVGCAGSSAALIGGLPGEYYLQVADDTPELISTSALAARVNSFSGALLGAWPAPFTSAPGTAISAAAIARVAALGHGGSLEPLYIAPPRLHAGNPVRTP
jgi:tRNA A37 threonylcarbamoyladenosine modification protein TsaB